MQDDIENEELQTKKQQLLQAAAKVAVKLRKIGKKKLCAAYNLPEPSLTRFERGKSDLQLSTIYRLAHAYGLKCHEFIKLIDEELPEDFTFRP